MKKESSTVKTKMKFMEFKYFLPNVMAVCRMLTRYTLYPQLCYGGVNDKLKYGIIKTVFEWANKKGTIEAGMVDKQKKVLNILNYILNESKLYKG